MATKSGAYQKVMFWLDKKILTLKDIEEAVKQYKNMIERNEQRQAKDSNN